jgi:cellulose biosynthesis protein BcsQ
VAKIAPGRTRSATRVVVVTGVAGGVGRTLLATNLAARIGMRTSVLVLDATGTGAAAWWLGFTPGSWLDLEGLVDELTAEHIAVVASERERVRLIGASGAMPSAALLVATARACEGWTDLVLVDAPTIADERTRGLTEIADRVLVLAPEGGVASAALDALAVDDRTWVIAARSRAERIGPHAVLRALPDDPVSIRSAARGRSAVGGALGRAYDDLAELLALDLR